MNGTNIIFFDTLGNMKFSKRYFETISNIQSPTGEISNGAFLFSGVMDGVHGLLLKADSSGQLLFSSGYGDSLNWTVSTDAFTLTTGNILTLGYNRDFADDNFDLVVSKFDSQGNFITGRKLDVDVHDISNRILTLNSSEFLITSVNYLFPILTGKLFILKIDSNANIIWSKYYSAGFDIPTVTDMVHADDGSSYFMIASSYILKIDSNGNPLWLLQILANEEFSGSTLKLIHNNLLIAGNLKTDSIHSSHGTILEMDTSGQILWAKKITLYGNNEAGAAAMVNNSIFVAGNVTVDSTKRDYYFISKTFAGSTLGCDEEIFEDISIVYYQVTDSDVAATVKPFGKQYSTTWEQTESGVLSNYCSDNLVEEVTDSFSCLVFPNPFTTTTTITLTSYTAPFNVKLFDELGREAPLQFHSTQQGNHTVLAIDRGALLSRMYFLSITSQEKREVVKVMAE